MSSFREATAEWALPGIEVEGVRLSVADVDGDGFADLSVRAVGNHANDFAEDGRRVSWLLRNVGGTSFEDITEQSGIRATRGEHGGLGRPGEVVVFADVDNDGDIDAYTGMNTGISGAMDGETSELMLNDGSGTFELSAIDDPIRRSDGVDAVAGASFTDIDRDGLLDIWVGEHNYTPAGSQSTEFLGDHLYRGTGSGRFEEITAEAGLTTEDWITVTPLNEARAHSRAWSTNACDLDGDGTPELLTASYGRAPNHLWRGQRNASGGVSFTNHSVASGYAFDDNFNWTDNEFAKCYCQGNRGADGCSEVTSPRINCNQVAWRHDLDRELFRLGGNSGATVCADLNNDGAMDLFTTEITHWWAGSSADRSELLLNTREADLRFERPRSDATGVTRDHDQVSWDQGDMSAAAFDFDNDGYLDLYIGASDYPGNRGLLYHQASLGRFESVDAVDGIDHPRSHGVAVADFDRDGDLDVVVGHSRARCEAASDCLESGQIRFFENIIGEQGNWLQVRLTGGSGTNRQAIGARVTIRTTETTQTREINGGYGHYGAQPDSVLHFGLGGACDAEVTVRWPNRELTTETFYLVAGYRFHIEQGGEPEIEEIQ
jgi:hypothetical protein